MFEQVLPGNTKTILALLEGEGTIQKAYLAGGTALALQLGHRISYDLDFFGHFKGVRFSIFYYEYPLLAVPKKFGKINIVDLPDSAAMKVAAIASRGTKRDFVDLYAACQEGPSLEDCMKFYNQKFQNLASTAPHIMKSLVYFDDAEKDDMPHMLKNLNWPDVKDFFQHHVKKIAHRFL